MKVDNLDFKKDTTMNRQYTEKNHMANKQIKNYSKEK